MHLIGTTTARVHGYVPLYECDTCGVAVSDPDLYKSFTGHDAPPDR